MKKLSILFSTVILALIMIPINSFTQNVSINNTGANANSNAILDISNSSNDKGVLIPRITTAQRTSISGLSSTEEGLTVYDKSTDSFWLWDGSNWKQFTLADSDGKISVTNIEAASTTYTGLSATSASALSIQTGMVIYVNSTNGTFTSAGFWGYDGSAWLKFETSTGVSSPSVTTTAASSIAQSSATSGGNVTSNGGAAVSAYGVCWSTNSSPTILDNTTNDGSGTGSFSSSITGLTASTSYYVRAYATNSQGTSYGNQVSFTSSTPPAVSVGDSHQGGTVFYILQSGDAGYDANVQHGLIVSVFEINSSNKDTQYGCKNTLNNTGSAIGTGAANTAAILATCSTSGIAAKLCDDYSTGGYSDWYLPSEFEMVELYNASTYGGGTLTLSTNLSSIEYYTSTETSAEKAYHLHFNGYNMHEDKKDKTKNVRAVRSF